MFLICKERLKAVTVDAVKKRLITFDPMKSKFVIHEGHDNLQKELDFPWRKERPEVTEKISWAASLGGRLENADYQYNKQRLREIDRRIRYLVRQAL